MKLVVAVKGEHKFLRSGTWEFHEHLGGFSNSFEVKKGEPFELEKEYVLKADTLDECLEFADHLARGVEENHSFTLSDEWGFVELEEGFDSVSAEFVRFAHREEEPDFWTDSDGDWVDF